MSSLCVINVTLGWKYPELSPSTRWCGVYSMHSPIKCVESVSSNLKLFPKVTVRLLDLPDTSWHKESGTLHVSPRNNTRGLYMGNSQPYTLVVSVKIFLRAERSKNSPKELYRRDDSKRGKETRIITLVLSVVWLRSMGDIIVSDILCRWWVNREI